MTFEIIFTDIWIHVNIRFFLRHFRDLIRVPRIENQFPRIRETYHRVSRIKENQVLRIREIWSLPQVQTGHLIFSLKKPVNIENKAYIFPL